MSYLLASFLFFSKCYFIRKPQGSQHRPFWTCQDFLRILSGQLSEETFHEQEDRSSKKRSYGQKRAWLIFIDFSWLWWNVPALCFIANDAIALLTAFFCGVCTAERTKNWWRRFVTRWSAVSKVPTTRDDPDSRQPKKYNHLAQMIIVQHPFKHVFRIASNHPDKLFCRITKDVQVSRRVKFSF